MGTSTETCIYSAPVDDLGLPASTTTTEWQFSSSTCIIAEDVATSTPNNIEIGLVQVFLLTLIFAAVFLGFCLKAIL